MTLHFSPWRLALRLREAPPNHEAWEQQIPQDTCIVQSHSGTWVDTTRKVKSYK